MCFSVTVFISANKRVDNTYACIAIVRLLLPEKSTLNVRNGSATRLDFGFVALTVRYTYAIGNTVSPTCDKHRRGSGPKFPESAHGYFQVHG